MRVSTAPDIFQGIMTKLLGNLNFVKVYINYIIITSNGTYTDHLEKLNQVLEQLAHIGLWITLSI
jgi:hypothetical protein